MQITPLTLQGAPTTPLNAPLTRTYETTTRTEKPLTRRHATEDLHRRTGDSTGSNTDSHSLSADYAGQYRSSPPTHRRLRRMARTSATSVPRTRTWETLTGQTGAWH